MTRRRLRALAAIGTIVLAATVASCNSPNPQPVLPRPSGSPQDGGTYRFPLKSDPLGIEPLTAQDAGGMQVAHQVFQGLVAYELDKGGVLQTVPALAIKWKANSTATVFTFTLRHGVHFQPPVAREVTASDFVRSWTRVTDPANACPKAYILAPILGCDNRGYQLDPIKGLSGLRAIGRYTLRVQLRYPFADFPNALGTTVAAVTPVDYIDSVGEKAFARRPVGTGPYLVQSWTPRRGIDLVRNSTYWDTGHAGHVDRIQFPIVPSAATMWRQFRAGALDMTEVPEGQIRAARNDPHVASGAWTAVLWPKLSVTLIGIDMKDPVLGTPGAISGALLRQALTRATDRAAVCNIVQEGVPVPATGLVPPGTPGFRDSQSPYEYNPERAQKLVAQTIMSGGYVPPIGYWYVDGPIERETSVALQAAWQTAGMTAVPAGFKQAAFDHRLQPGPLTGSQLFRMNWSADYPSMDAFLSPLFQSQRTPSGSYTFYSNAAVHELLLKARSTVDDTQRHNLYAMAEKGILADAPVIPLTFERDFRVLNERVQDQILDPLGFVDMWKVWVRSPAAAS
jgi:peptide/nickel transport system substrate-binding protein/oligopeptide transport system substrate-binding protein